MPKVVIRARYQDEQAVKAELLKIFPTAVMGIKVTSPQLGKNPSSFRQR